MKGGDTMEFSGDLVMSYSFINVVLPLGVRLKLLQTFTIKICAFYCMYIQYLYIYIICKFF
jgi:hypothetical protein